ncbi:CDP-diacylglycerol--glycerol-3-phosphate 3-phosphatidyltransferase 2-like [Bidens hawaiensis]|uniref:CDP-diacylglycerol--glycerol-3-phosphate 3-phosphatidyltransferase 2-like n=1 Tax=Bidens hawaiensis TaxID=980011 RepID=UPI00404A1289
MCSSWRKTTTTTTTCTASAHDNNNNNNNRLGFRGHKNKAVAMGSVNGVDKKLTTELKPPPANKLLTLPTMLTIGRVFAIPIIVTTFYLNSRLGTTVTTCIFIAAAITDWLDGYLARKMNLRTAFGAFLDPVADKLMVATTLVLLCTEPPEAAMLGQWPWLLTVPSIAMIGREITMSAVREWAASQGSKLSGAVAVNNLGKWKTATQMTSLTILLAIRDPSFTKVGLLGASGIGLLYVSAGLAVWSLVVYMKKISKVLLLV